MSYYPNPRSWQISRHTSTAIISYGLAIKQQQFSHPLYAKRNPIPSFHNNDFQIQTPNSLRLAVPTRRNKYRLVIEAPGLPRNTPDLASNIPVEVDGLETVSGGAKLGKSNSLSGILTKLTAVSHEAAVVRKKAITEKWYANFRVG